MQDFDNMPMKESMRSNIYKQKPCYVRNFGNHGDEKRHNKFCNIVRKIKRSIGENYDNVYSWFCNKYKTDSDFGYLKSYFLSCFVEFYPSDPEYAKHRCEFILDENKNIQLNPEYKTENYEGNNRIIIQNIHWNYYKIVHNKPDPFENYKKIPITEQKYNELLSTGYIPNVDLIKKPSYTIKIVSKQSREWKQYNGSGQRDRNKDLLYKMGICPWDLKYEAFKC